MNFRLWNLFLSFSFFLRCNESKINEYSSVKYDEKLNYIVILLGNWLNGFYFSYSETKWFGITDFELCGFVLFMFLNVSQSDSMHNDNLLITLFSFFVAFFVLIEKKKKQWWMIIIKINLRYHNERPPTQIVI